MIILLNKSMDYTTAETMLCINAQTNHSYFPHCYYVIVTAGGSTARSSRTWAQESDHLSSNSVLTTVRLCAFMHVI